MDTLFLSLLVAAPLATLAQTRSAVVQTTLGSVQGLRKTVNNVEVDVYYGIPFAKPPVGDLRFKRPEAAMNWTGVKNTTQMPNSCLQSIDTAFDQFKGVDMWNPNTNVSEDCLYLNLWVPRGSQPPRTTMVWIFGGGFFAGTSTLQVYDGSNMAASQNVIVVSLNYRLGALGFLFTGTQDAPGNMGLLDQVMALQWVHDNIHNFGGSRDAITVFGESAGGMSTGYHMLSPLSKDLFTRAIMQSASVYCPIMLQTNSSAFSRARRLARDMGCPERPEREMVSCLREKDAQAITDTMWNTVEYYFDVPHPTVVDGYFLPEHPHDLIRKGEVKDTEVLLGANKDEGTFWLLYAFPDDYPLNNSGQVSRSRFRELIHGVTLNGNDEMVDAYVFEYSDSVVPSLRRTYRELVGDMAGDDLFTCPVADFANDFAKNHSVFLYSFQHRLANNPWPAWTGVMHGYEVEAVFGLPEEFQYSTQDRDLASRVMSYWTNFAETGNPNSGGVTVWPAMTSEGQEYLVIKGDGDTVENGLRYRKCAFGSREPPPRPSERPTCPTGGSTPIAYSLHFLIAAIVTSLMTVVNL
ncbi:hypothetical protein BaRGS_00019854 [Batillaria attramentaria]|uniref:Carboxylic ester hydrolase n=1 Tax=Batillaria attramentaria TaxID=370345 RepID=A0ABD0KNX5_9CAEN